MAPEGRPERVEPPVPLEPLPLPVKPRRRGGGDAGRRPKAMPQGARGSKSGISWLWVYLPVLAVLGVLGVVIHRVTDTGTVKKEAEPTKEASSSIPKEAESKLAAISHPIM